MKTCPICKNSFADELNFCLDDGGVLVESGKYDSEKTLAYSQEPTLQLSEQTQVPPKFISNQPSSVWQTAPNRNSRRKGVLILLSVGLFITFGIGGIYFLLFSNTREKIVDPPDIYWRSPSPTPTKTPTPKAENNIKVDILEKTTDGFGKKYLKCKVTNISENAIDLSFVGLSFYKGDVKIRDSGADLTLKILKPNQTIPIWVNLYGTDGYTSVKVKESVSTRPIRKPIEQIFPPLKISQSEMKAEGGYMSVNFRQYKTTYYKVSGIIQNPTDENISAQIIAIFYDEKGEIVGFGSTSSSNLAKGEKTRFEIQEVEADLFGKPKTFELIAISNR